MLLVAGTVAQADPSAHARDFGVQVSNPIGTVQATIGPVSALAALAKPGAPQASAFGAVVLNPEIAPGVPALLATPPAQKHRPTLAKMGPQPYDGGGRLDKRYDAVNEEFDPASPHFTGLAVVQGTCISACTIYLGASDVCVVESAVLWFHAPHEPGQFPPKVSEEGKSQIRKFYPPAIQRWIDKVHALDAVDLDPRKTLTGDQLLAMGFRRCTAKEIDVWNAKSIVFTEADDTAD